MPRTGTAERLQQITLKSELEQHSDLALALFSYLNRPWEKHFSSKISFRALSGSELTTDNSAWILDKFKEIRKESGCCGKEIIN